MAEYGFDRLLYGFTRFRTQNSFGDADDVLMLSNHSDAYLDAFVRSGLYNHAPMVKWAASNDGAASWRLIEEMVNGKVLTATEKKIIDLNQFHGVRAGYSISFPATSVRSKGAIGLCAPIETRQHVVDTIWAEYGREILLINNMTHLKIISMPFSLPRRSLTPRQREALEWVGDGKTMQDIATIMGLTPATVEKHLRLAREALNVETTAQAVLKASFQNQIFVVSL
ncbi:MAG: LuxR family transcriptional regulator [Rhodobacteraceae bacterium]|nr:LuxR family transcriptional regulator [Paracoccaceae bacterium]